LDTLVADNVGNFETKSEIHSIRHKSGFHAPNANLTGQQKHVYYAGTKLCNALQPNIKILNHNTKVFIPLLKGSLLAHLQNLLKVKVLKLCVHHYAIFDRNTLLYFALRT
jgi:hypothetical protein